MKELKAEMLLIKRNQTRNSLNITSETKLDEILTKILACLQNISQTGKLSIRAFSSDRHHGPIVSLHVQALSRHMSNINRSQSDKI